MTAKQQIIIDYVTNAGGVDKLGGFKAAYELFQTDTKSDLSYAYFTNIVKLNAAGRIKTTPFISEVAHSSISTTVCPKLWKSKDILFDDAILVPLKTGTIIDKVISIAGGVMPATITIMPGESGCGKTTMALYICSLVKTQHPDARLLFVSSEMNSIHIFKYAKRIDMSGIEVYLMSESDSPKAEFEKVLEQGWDIVILDSLQDTISKIRLETGNTANMVENDTLKLLDNTRRGNNDLGKYTAFLCTQHMTKGGTYTGSTNLKHMTDAMMEIKTDPRMPDMPFIEYSKNRDGQKDKKLFFKIRQNDIEFNADRFESDARIDDKVSQHKELISQKSFNFDQIFLADKTLVTEEEETTVEAIEIEDMHLSGADWKNDRKQIVGSNEILAQIEENQ